MRILVISPFNVFSTSSGFATRLYNLIEQMSYRHEIYLLYVNLRAKENGNYSDCFSPLKAHYAIETTKRWGQLLNPSLITVGLKVIKEDKIDLIFAESHWAGLHAMILHALTRIPYYFDEQNAEYVRWKRMGNRFCFLLKIYEKYCCKFANKIFCVSEIDKQLIHELGVEKCKLKIIPNGVDLNKFRTICPNKYGIRKKLNLTESTPIIFFSGSLNYLPNLQAVQVIYNHLLGKVLGKIPDAKFLIVGSNPPLQYIHKSILFTGFVERIEDYINASDVVIAPLISGGGTKLKIIEALSCGKTVITTDIGAEGLTDDRLTGILRIADNWENFADIIIEVLSDDNRHNIKDIDEFIKNYSWETIGNSLCKELV